MSKGVLCVLLLFWASAVPGSGQPAKENKPETVARWHFVGTKQLSKEEDLKVLNEILALKETGDLRNVAVQTFATQIAGRFGNDTNANAALAALIKPLLADLIQNESQFALETQDNQGADWALRVELPQERISEWSKNLNQIAEAAKMEITRSEKGGDWSAKREKYQVTFKPSKDGLLLEGGLGEPGRKARKLNLGKRSGKQVLAAEVNLPAVGKIWSSPTLEHGPKLNLTVVPRKEGLRSEMLIEYAQSLKITPEPWKIPTELIRDPLVGFTAIQGVSEGLGRLSGFDKLGAERAPNQVFLWAQTQTPFTVFAAADVGNPAKVISNLVTTVLPDLKDMGGRIIVATNRPAIVWRGFPIAVPFIEAADDGASPFLVAGLFPLSTKGTKPAPEELFAQLKKKNLVYYDWEITSERLKQLRAIWQFAYILQGRTFPTSASEQWLDAVFPRVGNAVTEVTLENKNRLKLVRQSETGLSALEMLLLAHGVDPYDVNAPHTNPGGPRPAQRKQAVPQRVNPAAPKP